jgi:hypothetical protein
MFELHGKRGATDRAAKVRDIKMWVRELLGLSDEATVMVTELRCTEPGCPPIETVVAVLRTASDKSQFKIHAPIAEVTYKDVQAGAATMIRRHEHPH